MKEDGAEVIDVDGPGGVPVLTLSEVAQNPAAHLARLAVSRGQLSIRVSDAEKPVLAELDHFNIIYRRLFDPKEGEGVVEEGGDGNVLTVLEFGEAVMVVAADFEGSVLTLECAGWYTSHSEWIASFADHWTGVEEGNRVLTLQTFDEAELAALPEEDAAIARHVQQATLMYMTDALWSMANRNSASVAPADELRHERMVERDLHDQLPGRREAIELEHVDIAMAATWTSPVIDPSGGVDLVNFELSEVDVLWAADGPIFVVGDCFGEQPVVHVLIPVKELLESRLDEIEAKLRSVEVGDA